ncbi:MAG: dockerin type I repeat-containing protein [Oscillospiraceae bacterium]|nr:dockerin type I repeat-containing protein [Oscillospiraceae bacterium]
MMKKLIAVLNSMALCFLFTGEIATKAFDDYTPDSDYVIAIDDCNPFLSDYVIGSDNIVYAAGYNMYIDDNCASPGEILMSYLLERAVSENTDNPSLRFAIQIDEYCGYESQSETKISESQRLKENGICVIDKTDSDFFILIVSADELNSLPLSDTRGYKVSLAKPLTGDITMNSTIDMTDVVLLNKIVLGKEMSTDLQCVVGDVNHNSMIDSLDSLTVMEYVVGLIDKFN